MGASWGGAAFRLEPAGIDSAKVVHDLFGPGFQLQEGHGDTRKSDNVYVGKTKDLLIILSLDFAEKFFKSTDNTVIRQYLDYFNHPSFVFAFEEYDSGGTYSYSLIYDGQVKRQYSLVSGEERTDYGVPDPVERRWLDLPIETVQEDEETTTLFYVDESSGHKYDKDQLPSIILNALLKEKLGFISWDMGEYIVEEAMFKRVQPAAVAPAAKKPWWKLW